MSARQKALGRACVLTIVGVWACGSRTELPIPSGSEPCDDAGATRPCLTICGSGTESCIDGFWQGCTAPRPKPPALAGTIRDFRDDHPDFEKTIGDDRGIVELELGADDKPVYASSGVTATTHGAASFDQWYRDVPGVNAALPLTLELGATSSGLYQFEDTTFFPIDGKLFGNQGRLHNYHFSFEVATAFHYRGGEVFSFTGDDDLWVFINRRLAIDLGGVHGAESASIELDAKAGELGLIIGQNYALHLFFAERHTIDSDFRVHTSIAEFELCK